MFGLMSACSDTNTTATLSNTTMRSALSSHSIDPQVQQDGLTFNSSVSLQGLKGKTIEVAAYHDSTFLGVTQITPDKDEPESQDFGIFVPASSLYNLTPPYSLSLFVTDAEDRDHFLDSRTWTYSDYTGYQVNWEFVKLEENVDLDGGEKGIRITTNLHVHGYKDHSFRCYLGVQDQNGNDFADAQGGPISIDAYTINPIYDDTTWSNLVLNVPYSRLSQLPTSQEITITPVLQEGSNTIGGTLHVSALAGGPLDDVKASLQKDSDDNEAQIKAMEEQMRQLNKEAKK
jgi:hypothetical protein